MEEEYSSLMKNHTWDLCTLPKGRKLVRCKWLYCTKFFVVGLIDKYKAHLVVKGFSQIEGIRHFPPSPRSTLFSLSYPLQLHRDGLFSKWM